MVDDLREEMRISEEELDETLPFEEEIEEPTLEKPTEKKVDYLDEFSPTKSINRTQSQPLMFNDDGKDTNLVINLLRTDWERIEHIIRGHKPRIDKDGNEFFEKIEGHYLNERGVNSVLHYLSFYLSKDIRLARYKEEDVKIIMNQFSIQFTDWFFDNINELGLDTPEKKKMSKMFVHSVIALVDASYSCAIQGKTIELLLKQFQVLQQEPLGSQMNNPYQSPQRPKTPLMQRIFG